MVLAQSKEGTRLGIPLDTDWAPKHVSVRNGNALPITEGPAAGQADVQQENGSGHIAKLSTSGDTPALDVLHYYGRTRTTDG